MRVQFYHENTKCSLCSCYQIRFVYRPAQQKTGCERDYASVNTRDIARFCDNFPISCSTFFHEFAINTIKVGNFYVNCYLNTSTSKRWTRIKGKILFIILILYKIITETQTLLIKENTSALQMRSLTHWVILNTFCAGARIADIKWSDW